MKTQDKQVHPEDKANVVYWSTKWGVSIRQLNDAILATGSLNAMRLREYLKKDTWYKMPFFGLTRFLKNRGLVH